MTYDEKKNIELEVTYDEKKDIDLESNDGDHVEKECEPPEQDELDRAAAEHAEGLARKEDSDTEPDEDAPPAGAGLRGYGPPMRTGRYEKERDLCDGAGICSAGRWPPWRRPTTRDGKVLAIRAALRRAVLRTADAAEGGLHGLFGRLASGQVLESPFDADLKAELAEYSMSLFDNDGCGGARSRKDDLEQPVRIRLMQALLRTIGDPDAHGMEHFARGVRLGVGTRLPRTPAVYSRKTHWRLPEQAAARPEDFVSTDSIWRENYRSAKQCADAVQRQLDEHHARGLAIRVGAEEAERRFPGLRVSSLGAVIKAGEAGAEPSIRLVLDGSHGVDINTAIRVRDQDRCPTAADIKRQQREQALTRRGIGLAVDVSEAHRLPRVHPADWRLQGCRAHDDGDVFIYVVGVFGISSIAYWWSRMGGAAIRIIHGLLEAEMEVWIMMLADDIKAESTSVSPVPAILFVLLALELLGIPLSWKKVHGGGSMAWIGYQVDIGGLSLGITAARAAWATEWCARLARDGKCRADDLKAGVGRLGFIVGALEYERPFLAPLYSYSSRFSSNALLDLPLYVVTVLGYLAGRFALRRMYPSAVRRSSRAIPFRVDAHADEEGIGVGGWQPQHDANGRLSTTASRWFSMKLTKTNAPWAFCRGASYKVIASLEALAILLGFMLLTDGDAPNLDSTVIVHGVTDNKGNSYVLNKLMSTKYPLCVIVMELAAQMEKRGARLSVDWAPRDFNVEADELSNGVTKSFSDRLRVQADLAHLPWLVLPTLMQQGEVYERLRADTHEQRRTKKRKGERLRDTDPW